MTERFPFSPSTRPDPPLFPRKQTPPSGSARSGPGRETAKRTLDGEDRSEIIRHEGKGDRCRRFAQTNGFATIRPRTCFQGLRRCETVLQNRLVLQYHYAMLIG